MEGTTRPDTATRDRVTRRVWVVTGWTGRARRPRRVGLPVIATEVPVGVGRDARGAVGDCPALALRLGMVMSLRRRARRPAPRPRRAGCVRRLRAPGGSARTAAARAATGPP